MTEHQSSRTLVKSAPELWAECSDAASLARHLGAFGEIRITKLEPETAVAWEGAAASGTVKLETSGWGTRVTLTVTEDQAPPVQPEPVPDTVVAAVVEPEPVVIEEPEPVVEPEPESELAAADTAIAPRSGMLARFRGAFRRKPAAMVEPGLPEPEPQAVPVAGTPLEPQPVPVAEPPPEAEPVPVAEAPPQRQSGPLAGEDALVAALDSLGMAHHRPYSRS